MGAGSCASWVVGGPFEAVSRTSKECKYLAQLHVSEWCSHVASFSFSPCSKLRCLIGFACHGVGRSLAHAAPADGAKVLTMSQLKNIVYRMPGGLTACAVGLRPRTGPSKTKTHRSLERPAKIEPHACTCRNQQLEIPYDFPRIAMDHGQADCRGVRRAPSLRAAQEMQTAWPVASHTSTPRLRPQQTTCETLLVLDHMEPCVARAISSYSMVRRPGQEC